MERNKEQQPALLGRSSPDFISFAPWELHRPTLVHKLMAVLLGMNRNSFLPSLLFLLLEFTKDCLQ